jgi:hypothetical protein
VTFVTRTEEFQKWKQEGSELLSKFEAQLADKMLAVETLTAEIEVLRADIEEMRSTLPRAATRVSNPTTTRAVLQGMARVAPDAAPPSVRVSSNASVADVVRAVLEVANFPIPAKAVIQLVNGVRETVSEDVHRALYRLKEAGEVEVTGTRPNSLYAIKEAQTAIQLAK